MLRTQGRPFFALASRLLLSGLMVDESRRAAAGRRRRRRRHRPR